MTGIVRKRTVVLPGLTILAFMAWCVTSAASAIPGGSLDPESVPKYATPLLIPPVMPKAGTIIQSGGKGIDYWFLRRICG